MGYEGIPDEKLLDQFGVFGADGQDDDEAVSFGWNLIIQQADKKVAQRRDEIKNDAPTYRLERTTNGILRPVVSGQTNTRNVPRSPFDRR